MSNNGCKWSFLERARRGQLPLTALFHKFSRFGIWPHTASEGWNFMHTCTDTLVKHIQTLARRYNLCVWTCRRMGGCVSCIILTHIISYCCMPFLVLNLMYLYSVWPVWCCDTDVAMWLPPYTHLFFERVRKDDGRIHLTSLFPAELVPEFSVRLWSKHCAASMSSSRVGLVGSKLAASPSETASTFWAVGSHAELRRHGCK